MEVGGPHRAPARRTSVHCTGALWPRNFASLRHILSFTVRSY